MPENMRTMMQCQAKTEANTQALPGSLIWDEVKVQGKIAYSSTANTYFGIADDLTKFYSITDLVEELIAGTRKPEAIQYVLQFAFKSVTSGYTISYLVIT